MHLPTSPRTLFLIFALLLRELHAPQPAPDAAAQPQNFPAPPGEGADDGPRGVVEKCAEK